jgi:glycosyltransferase involved in cell wall biosynthesis
MPLLLGQVKGPRVALFHDAIALKLPELTPPQTVARFPAYLDDLRMFDGIAAVSEDSRQALVEYWHWAGIAEPPPVVCIPLGIDVPRIVQRTATTNGTPVVLSVGSIEARKNHLALLTACESLWARGLQFQLWLIGHPQAQTGRPALNRIRELKAAGRPLRYDGATDDGVLEAAYAECAFTVYPSMMEGFGLPVLESLAHRKPCICSARGALGESAREGGCLTVPDVHPEPLAAAIETLLTGRETRERLADEAARRRFRTWADYATDLTAWMTRLPRTQDGREQAFRLP